MESRNSFWKRSLKLTFISFRVLYGLILGPLPALYSTSAVAAAMVMPLPFPNSVREAPIVIRGKIGASHTDWRSGPDGMNRIFTYSDLTVTELLKGTIPESIIPVIREPGGEKDGLGYTVPGSVQFKKGEEVVVLLKESDQQGVYEVQGMTMGKYTVQSEKGEEVLQGPGLLTIHNQNRLATSTDPWTVTRLKKLIRSHAAAVKAGEAPVEEESPPLPPEVNLNPKADAPGLESQIIGSEGVTGWVFLLACFILLGAAGIWIGIRAHLHKHPHV